MNQNNVFNRHQQGEYSNQMILPNPYSEYSCTVTFFRMSHRSSSNRRNSSNLKRHLHIAYGSRTSKRGLFFFPMHSACIELIVWKHTGDTAVLNVELKCLPTMLCECIFTFICVANNAQTSTCKYFQNIAIVDCFDVNWKRMKRLCSLLFN